ncbi:MAG: NAD-dependent epimerase/dehydratase family protein [Candidatus Thermoplasmatota archaeon]
MKVFVTGGSGFIGSYLVDELLKRGYEVKVLTRKKDFKKEGVEVCIGDITKPDSFFEYISDCDVVFHNAAYAMDWGKAKVFHNVNVEGTRNVALGCLKNGVNRLVYTSSAGVYGFPKNDERVIFEDSPINPLNHYQKTKLKGEEVLRGFDDLHASMVRPPMVFGPDSPALEIVFSKLENDDMMFIGSGDQEISIVHPVDVARCLVKCLERDEKGDVFNVVSFICSIKRLVKSFAEKAGLDIPERHVPFFIAYFTAILSEFFSIGEPSLTRFRVKSLGCTRRISFEKAAVDLGYQPEYDFSSTVDEIVKWYLDKKS